MRFQLVIVILTTCIITLTRARHFELNIFSSTIHNFTTQLYSYVSKSYGSSNWVGSSWNIFMAFSMLGWGDEGDTAKIMQQVINIPLDKNYAGPKFKELVDYSKNIPDVVLDIANKIFISNEFFVEDNYKMEMKKFFYAEVDCINVTDSERASALINDWVGSKTHQKIKNIINNPNIITPQSVLLLLSAINFESKWKTPFTAVDALKFKKSSTYAVDVVSMKAIGYFFYTYVPYLEAEWIQLPFKNEDFEMIIIKPTATTNLQTIEEKLEFFDYDDVIQINTHFNLYEIVMPKFHLDIVTDVKKHFVQSAMNKIFDSSYFSLISTDRLKVSEIIHKAFVEVNEKGVNIPFDEVLAEPSNSPFFKQRNNVIRIEVDEPFYFMIRNLETIFLQGRVLDPLEHNEKS